MSYVVLARKWRPQNFDDLVGQEHVATTLANSIAVGRVAHAFLFTGVRGVGKTTSARILAKALNCEKGPTAKPCLECSPCREIGAGNDMDVQEIDAASRTGVDDIRELQSNLTYQPARDRFKIFIVDEVHMLSASAWNAFLKTLEEPPPHVKFIFATTEVNKVPVTILSRCQRYDFKLISANVVAARLRFVLEKEGIAAEDGAVSILAREAAGSMRDAMSLLDQVIAWAGEEAKLTTAGVAKVLGIAEASVLYRLAEATLSGDAPTCLEIVHSLANAGYDVGHVARDLLAVLRDLVVARVAPDARALLEVPDSELADLTRIGKAQTVDDLVRVHQAFAKSTEEILKSPVPRASLEMSLVKLSRRPALVPIDDLVRKLADLESRLGGGGAAPAARPRPRASEPSDDPGPPAPPPSFAAAPAAPPAPPAPAPFAPPARFAAPTPAPAPASAPPASAPPAPAPPPASAPPASAPPPASSSPASVPPAYSSAPPSARPPFSAPNGARGSGPQPIFDPKDPRFARYASVVEAAASLNARVGSLLERAALVDVGDAGVTIAIDPKGFEASFIGEASSRATLDDAARQVLGPAARFTIVDLEPGTRVPTLAAMVKAASAQKRVEAEHALKQHPLIRAATEHLGAEVREVRLPAELDAPAVSLREAAERE
ncbi:MAG TPA: DNA polymerase III subunit gamma/tau [Polyangiaceae bacterium]|nr:DNA polymerase III subunit gamma/tau [Polyangiaceae bacterium]